MSRRRLTHLGIALGILLLLALFFWNGILYFIEDPMLELAKQTPVRIYYDASGSPVWYERTYDYQWRLPVPLSQVSPSFLEAIIATEDRTFSQHAGVSYASLFRAAVSNMHSGRVLSGASTISMQLSSLPLEGKRKTIPMKIRQIFQARKLEKCHTKEEILTEYVNRIPFGRKIYGIEAAARYYFDKPASQLEPQESILLAGLPQRPNSYCPEFYPQRAKRRQNRVILALLNSQKITFQQASQLSNAPLEYRDFGQPSFMARLAHPKEQMYLSLAKQTIPPQNSAVHTALHQELQEQFLIILQRKCRSAYSVKDAGAVVIHNPTRQVWVLIGTLNEKEPLAGLVNIATRPRCAGSTLKPFIYADAVNGGYIVDSTILMDAPLKYGTYAPINYDGLFLGEITATEALSSSLNTPAIRLLAELGLERELLLFQQLHILPKGHFSPEKIGLPLALGATHHTLLNLANAYSTLASQGIQSPVSFTKTGHSSEKEVIFTPETTAMISKMLRHYPLENTVIDAAWKTGTSNGLHDAWCFAYTPDYTLGVWFGNKDGSPSSALVGKEIAAPVAGQFISLLYRNQKQPEWPTEESYTTQALLCKHSGLLASDSCQETRQGALLKNCPLRKCQQCSSSKTPPLLLLSPKSKLYLLEEGQECISIPLEANQSNVSWYIDGEYYEFLPKKSLRFYPGTHKIHLISKNAQTHTVSFSFNVQKME